MKLKQKTVSKLFFVSVSFRCKDSFSDGERRCCFSAKVMEEKLRYAAYNCIAIDTDTSPTRSYDDYWSKPRLRSDIFAPPISETGGWNTLSPLCPPTLKQWNVRQWFIPPLECGGQKSGKSFLRLFLLAAEDWAKFVFFSAGGLSRTSLGWSKCPGLLFVWGWGHPSSFFPRHPGADWLFKAALAN